MWYVFYNQRFVDGHGFENFHVAMGYARKLKKAFAEEGKDVNGTVTVMKCGGCPRQCCIDNTVVHYV